jgi:excisionase family DNA binding protein
MSAWGGKGRRGKPQDPTDDARAPVVMTAIDFENYVRRLAREEAEKLWDEKAIAFADEWMTVQETAGNFGVSTWTVYEAIKRGQLAAYRPYPRVISIRRSDAERWLRRHADEPPLVR